MKPTAKVDLGLAPQPAKQIEIPLPHCRDCHWARWHGTVLRCHYSPPIMRLPYENVGHFAPIPEDNGPTGCSFFKPKEHVKEKK